MASSDEYRCAVMLRLWVMESSCIYTYTKNHEVSFWNSLDIWPFLSNLPSFYYLHNLKSYKVNTFLTDIQVDWKFHEIYFYHWAPRMLKAWFDFSGFRYFQMTATYTFLINHFHSTRALRIRHATLNKLIDLLYWHFTYSSQTQHKWYWGFD